MCGACAVTFRVHAQDWIPASVFTDGGSVYSKPDFDAAVTDYLAFKTPLSVSRNAIPGEGGLGLFYRVKYGDKVGYMADTDIRMSQKGSSSSSDRRDARKGKKKQDSKAWDDDEDERAKSKKSMYLRRYVGLALADMNYTEKFGGKNYSSQMMMYGLRATGPGILWDGPPIDINIWFTLAAPSY